MRLALLLSVLHRIHAAVYPMTLTSLQYPSPSTGAVDANITNVPLRGPFGRRGDVWGPAIPGTNILPCGSLGNKEIYDRMEVQKGIPFNVMGRIWSTRDGTGTLTFSIKYGSSPDFRASSGMFLLEFSPDLPRTPLEWVITTQIPEPAFSDNATIQVEYLTGYRPDNWTEPFVTTNEVLDRPWSVVYQCIDVVVIGAAPRPPGAGESYNPEDYDDPDGPGGTRGVTTTEPSSDSSILSPLYIGLIVAAIVIAICLIILLVCCLCRKKKPPKEEEVPENTENIKAKPVAPPTSPPEGQVVRLHFEEPEATPVAPGPKTPEEDGPKEGSFGRLFHFKYVEADEEHGAEDLLKQQQRTLEKRALQQEFDQASTQ